MALDILTATSTVALLLVTAFYAWKTKQMADTARDAAADSLQATKAAERAALAAQQTAAVAQSQVRVEFVGSMIGVNGEAGELVWALQIRSRADAVVVQEVRVRRALRESQIGDRSTRSEVDGLVLKAVNTESELPRRLHQSDELQLTHELLQDQGRDLYVSYSLDIKYTFDENDPAGGACSLLIESPA